MRYENEAFLFPDVRQEKHVLYCKPKLTNLAQKFLGEID